MYAALGIVAVLQAGIAVAGGVLLWLVAGSGVATSYAAGAFCTLTGTTAYAACVALNHGVRASRVLRAHLLGQAAKVTVAVTLLIAALNSDWNFDALPLIGGFAAAALVYPFALLIHTETK